MVTDKETEIKLEFLDEAEDYLNTIETVLLTLSDKTSADEINASLRAAHSVKGGAGMMGFEELSSLAHRLEDFFKVIKSRKQLLDEQVQSLILLAVDYLRQVIVFYKTNTKIEEKWVENKVNPVLDKLYSILGEAPNEQLVSLEEGNNQEQSMAVLLFETEVEGCLQRLEGVLTNPNKPYLLEECSILAQEFNALAEMIELNAFATLNQSIIEYIEKYPEKIEQIAPAALESWRRTQALVLLGQTELLPTAIYLEGITIVNFSIENIENIENLEENSLSETTENQDNNFGDLPLDISLDLDQLLSENSDLFAQIGQGIDLGFDNFDRPINSELVEESILEIPAPELPAEITQIDFHPTYSTKTNNISFSTLITDIKQETTVPESNTEKTENTIRVPLKYLEQLNDLCGELTIQRNSLELRLTRIFNLLYLLNRRISSLEQSNLHLRNIYDKISIPDLVSNSINNYYYSQNNYNSQNNPSAFSSGFDILELDRYNELHLISQEIMETIVQIKEVETDIELSLDEANQTAREINQSNKQLQINLTQARMRPLSDIVGRFPRALRDMCLEYSKNVELKIYGGGTLIDRTILEALGDPLMHLLRNSFDHGIETPETRIAQGKPEKATIEIRAGYRGSQTIITISDDGQGINLEKVRDRALKMGIDSADIEAAGTRELLALIFEPGFSTAEQVTAISGRGVGMDIVRTNLNKIRGTIEVETDKGVGTTFTIAVPFTLSVMRVLLIESQNMILAIPKDAIEEMILLESAKILRTGDSAVLNWEEQLVPLITLDQWLQFNCPHKQISTEELPTISEPTALLISQGSRIFALKIDRCWGEQEVAVRQVEGSIPLPVGFAGCTILGDGRIVPLVDVPILLQWLTNGGELANSSDIKSLQLQEKYAQLSTIPDLFSHNPAHPPNIFPDKNTILIVDDSINVRRFLALSLEKAGYDVEQAKDGQEAVEKLLSGLEVQFVICDIEMPRLDGYGFLSKIKSDPKFNHLPIAMLTSRSGDKHRKLAMSLGASAYFSKPYKEQELIKTIKDLITQYAVKV
jgi:two-component system, chemotaxis family, sensor histidine kinase and response regulator PixL